MTIFYHPNFIKAYKKLPTEIKKRAEKKEVIFRKDIFDKRLKTHKLSGRLKNQLSFSIDKKNRIIFEITGKDVIFLDVGDHDIYR